MWNSTGWSGYAGRPLSIKCDTLYILTYAYMRCLLHFLNSCFCVLVSGCVSAAARCPPGMSEHTPPKCEYRSYNCMSYNYRPYSCTEADDRSGRCTQHLADTLRLATPTRLPTALADTFGGYAISALSPSLSAHHQMTSPRSRTLSSRHHYRRRPEPLSQISILYTSYWSVRVYFGTRGRRLFVCSQIQRWLSVLPSTLGAHLG